MKSLAQVVLLAFPTILGAVSQTPPSPVICGGPTPAHHCVVHAHVQGNQLVLVDQTQMYISVQKGISIEWIVDDAGEYFVVALDYDARTFIFSSKDDIFFKGNLGNSAGSTVVTALPNVTKNYLIYFKKDDQHKYVLDPKVIVNPGPGPDPKGVKGHRISTQGPDPDDYYRCASPCSIEASIQRRRLVFNEERRRYVAVDNGDELQWSIPGVREFTVGFDYDPNNYIFQR